MRAPICSATTARRTWAGPRPTAKVGGVVPDSGLLYVTIHLEYGLIRTSGWTRTGEKAVGSDSNTDTSGSFKCIFPDGPASSTVSVTVDDGDGGSDSDSIVVTVANVAAAVTASFTASSVGCGTNNATLNFSFTDPGVDTHTASVDWGDGSAVQSLGTVTSPFAASHTYAAAGMYIATVTVTDDDGDSGSDSSNPLTVNFTIVGGGMQPPINQDGSSVFKYKSTIPVKIKVADCNGSVPSNLAPTIMLTQLDGSMPGEPINEPFSTSAADTTGIMRFTGSPDYQYIYNLATKPLPDPTAHYRIKITIPLTGQIVEEDFGLKN